MTNLSITCLLDAARTGDAEATNALFNAIYDEMKRLAQSHRRRWNGNHTMSTTAIVHEAYLKLSGVNTFEYANRVHFFATASKAMRQILVNYAEQQSAGKRGGKSAHITMDDSYLSTDVSPEELLDLNRSLTRMEAQHPRRSRIFEYRVFGGLTIEEIAQALSISSATVKREWQIASARVYQDMETTST